MGKAIASTSEDVQKEVVREERVSGGWDRFEMEERRVRQFVKPFCLERN